MKIFIYSAKLCRFMLFKFTIWSNKNSLITICLINLCFFMIDNYLTSRRRSCCDFEIPLSYSFVPPLYSHLDRNRNFFLHDSAHIASWFCYSQTQIRRSTRLIVFLNLKVWHRNTKCPRLWSSRGSNRARICLNRSWGHKWDRWSRGKARILYCRWSNSNSIPEEGRWPERCKGRKDAHNPLQYSNAKIQRLRRTTKRLMLLM